MCFDPKTIYMALSLLAVSFIYMLYACCTGKAETLPREEKRKIREKIDKQKKKKVSEGKLE